MTSRPLRKNSHHDDDDYEEDIALTNASGGNDHYAQNVEYSRSAADGRRRTRDDHSHGDDDDDDDPDEYGSYEQGPSAGAGGGRNGASGGTTAGLMDHIQEARQREQYVQTQKKKRRYLIIGAVLSSIVILAGAAVGAYFIWDKQFKNKDPSTISSAEEPQSSSKEPPSTSTPIDTFTEEEGTNVIEESGPPPSDSNVTSNMTDTSQGGGDRFCALITGGTNASMPSFSIGDDYGSPTDTTTSSASRFRTRLKHSEDNLQRRDLQGAEPKCHPDGITCTSDQDCIAAYGGEDGLLYASCVDSCDDSGAAPLVPGVDEGTTTAGYCSGSSLDIGGSEDEPEKLICHPQKIVCNTNEDCFDFSVQDPSFLDGMLFMTQLCSNECEDLTMEEPTGSSAAEEQSNFTTILTLEEREECLLTLEEQDLFCDGIIVAISAAAEGGNTTNSSTVDSTSDVTAAVPDKCMVTTQECRSNTSRRLRLLRKRNLQSGTTSDVEVDFQLTWDAVSDETSSSMSKTDQFLQYTSNSNFVQDLTEYLEEGSNSTFKVVYMTFPTLLLEVDDKVTNGTSLNETTALGGCGYEEETVDYYGYMNTETVCLDPLVPCNTDSDCLSSAVVGSNNTTVICMTSCAFNETRLPEEYSNETDASSLNETIVDDSTLDMDVNVTDTNVTSLESNETEVITDSNMTDPLLDGNFTETNTTNVTDSGTNMTDIGTNITDTTNTTDMNNMTEIIPPPPPVAKGVCGSYTSSSSSSSFIARQELARRRRNLQRLRQAQDDVPLVPPSFPPPGIDLGTGLGVPLPPPPPEDYYPNATTTTSILPAIETTSTTSLNDTTGGIPPPSIGLVDEFAPVDIGIPPSDESYYNLSIASTGPLLPTDSNTTLPEVSPINDDPVIVDQNVNFEANLTNTTEGENNIIIDYYDDIGINDVTTTNNTNTTTNTTFDGDLICDSAMIPCVSDDECSYMDDDENIYMCLQECMVDTNYTDPEVNITFPELNNTDFNNTDFNNTDFNNTDIITNVTNTTEGGLLGGIVNVSQVVNEILGIFTSGNGYCGYQVAKEFVHNNSTSDNSTSNEFDILGFFEQGVGTSTPSTSLVDNICDVSGQRCNTDEDCQVSDETLVCLERCEPPPPIDDTITTSSTTINTINSLEDVGTIATNGDDTNTTSAEPIRMRCGIPVSPDLTNDESSNAVVTDAGIAISCSTEYTNDCDDDLECAFELESPIAKCVPECYEQFQQ